jgi:hypothetical protein
MFLGMTQGFFYRNKCCRNFKKGSFDWKLIGGQVTPLSRPPFPQKLPVKILEYPFCSTKFKDLEIVFEENTPPTALRVRVVSFVQGA